MSADRTSLNFFLNKRPKGKISLKKENVRITIVHLCQIQHGVIQTRKVIY